MNKNPMIQFEAKLIHINGWRILRFPVDASRQLPSRGMVMVRGTLNGVSFEAPLEPDGAGSHWFPVSDVLASAARTGAGDVVSLSAAPINKWSEPEVPTDLLEALESEGVLYQWMDITVRARWEWIRWIRFTNNEATRQKRIHVTCSKLKDGKKRPCCFDLSRCTVMSVSKNGVLLIP